MTIDLINLGTYPNDGTGDPIRTAFLKINDNFSQFSPVAFSGEYDSLFGLPVLSTVATTGRYSDLLDLPSLGTLASLSFINNINWAGTALSINNGGTGQTTAINAFNAFSPISAPGDILIGNSSGESVRLPIGSNTNVLTVINNSPQWTVPVGPGGYNSQIQFNNNGFFAGATALSYSQSGNYLTISSLGVTGVPLSIIAMSGQVGDLLDFTLSGNTQGNLAKFTANGSLYIQGNAGSSTSLELSNTHFYGQYFQTKTTTGAYGPYMKTVDGDEVRLYQANGQPIWSIGWGDDCFFHRPFPGYIYHHNYMNPCFHQCHNWWQDDNHWEACGFDWVTEPNVCRVGTHHLNGNPREMHFITGGIVAAKIDINQNFVCQTGQLHPGATDGFWHCPQINGAPTGAPTFFSGASPFCIDVINTKLWVSINGNWHYCSLT